MRQGVGSESDQAGRAGRRFPDEHAQLDYALSWGVNLVDAAGMYPLPHKPQTQGRIELYIGAWLARMKRH